MNDYQRGIRDLQDLFRKHGAILLGIKGLKKEYHNFLLGNGIKPRKGTKIQKQILRHSQYYGFPPTKKIETITGTLDSSTDVYIINFK